MRRAGNLTTFTCRLSLNLGNSTSWNLQGSTDAICTSLSNGNGLTMPFLRSQPTDAKAIKTTVNNITEILLLLMPLILQVNMVWTGLRLRNHI
jgi:hypothetical protein